MVKSNAWQMLTVEQSETMKMSSGKLRFFSRDKCVWNLPYKYTYFFIEMQTYLQVSIYVYQSTESSV